MSKLVVKDNKNNEIECDVLFMFSSDETNKDYVVFTDNSVNNKKQKKIYVSSYEMNKNEINLKEIKTDKEFKTVQLMLKKFSNQ